ncbi:hypothetical protein AWENTII_002164 [Aspergillus wentii]
MSGIMLDEKVLSLPHVPAAPEDPLYRLMREYREDKSDKKMDLGIGAYRDETGSPWVLPVVQKAHDILHGDFQTNHEYLPIRGLDSFLTAAQALILGPDSPAIGEQRICSFQTISGTGALYLGARFFARFHSGLEKPTAFISNPTWPNHYQIFTQCGLGVDYYPYYSPGKQGLDIDAMLETLRNAPRSSVVVLQGCAHNPTGIDPSQEEWKKIAEVIRDRDHFPFFDCAYQGFASGDLSRDAWACRYFVEQGFNCCIAQSFAKNLGLYGERVGAFHLISAPGRNASDICNRVATQLALLQRAQISNPPSYGARIAGLVLNNEQLFSQWQDELRVMSNRLCGIREEIRAQLEARSTPGSWAFLSSQIGMFSYTGLSKSQILCLKHKWNIYMAENGRISVAGLNPQNLNYFIDAVDDVVRSCT